MAHTWLFLAGYLIVWLAFSVAATALQWTLEQWSLVSAMSMWSASAYLSAAVLLAAGFYQWTPLKDVCLRHCRAPGSFLSRHWKPGARGAFQIGLRHGTYCVGCCWTLMALLFVGGVMNPVWIAAIAILVLLEKTMPGDRLLSRLSGLAFIVWGVATLLV
jgi:predicted metal-binding membrane protein